MGRCIAMRIRTVKPEFWSDEEISSVHPETALLAIGLLNHSDDEGYFKANNKLVSAAIFPLRECSMSVHDMLHELSRIGYIELSNGTDGHLYGRVVHFLKHQSISRPHRSRIKDVFGDHVVLNDQSMIDHGAITVGMDQGMDQGTGIREGTREGGDGPEESSVPPTESHEPVAVKEPSGVAEVIEHYKQEHPTSRPGAKERAAIKARLKDGYTAKELCHAIDGCHHSPHHCGQNETGTKYQALTLIMRDAAHVDMFIAESGRTRVTAPQGASVDDGGFFKAPPKKERTPEELAELKAIGDKIKKDMGWDK
jgi:hypothetical protein